MRFRKYKINLTQCLSRDRSGFHLENTLCTKVYTIHTHVL